MSATLCWRPVTSGGAISPGRSTAGTIKSALEHVFGDMPLRLDEDSIELLSAMQHAFVDKEHNPYADLISLIEEHKEIEVYATY